MWHLLLVKLLPDLFWKFYTENAMKLDAFRMLESKYELKPILSFFFLFEEFLFLVYFLKAFAPISALIPAVEKPSTTNRAFLLHDNVSCEVLEVSTDTEKIVCGMKGTLCLPENRERLGLITTNEFPPVFK